MDDKTVDTSLELQRYYSRVAAMDEAQVASHLRVNYSDPSQEWPDYLDYLDDWEHHYARRLNDTQRDFVFHLATRATTFVCKDHVHKISVIKAPDVIHFPNRDSFIDYTSCWFKTIAEADEKLVRLDPQATAARLSVPESEALKLLTMVRLVSQDSMTPIRLDFDQFRKDWLNKESSSQAIKIFQKSNPRPLVIPADLEEMSDTLDLPGPAPWLNMPDSSNSSPSAIWDADNVKADHAFHLLLLARPDRLVIIEMMNRIRSVDPQSTLLDPVSIAHCMDYQCSQCTELTEGPQPILLTTTAPGVYYAPPGNGKTTASRHGNFIGIDSDWLLRRSNFKTTLLPFLQRGIPVVTNQYTLIKNSSYKLFGSFNKYELRTDDACRPYTPLKEILAAKADLQDDATIIFTKEFLANSFLTLIRANFIYEFTRQKFASFYRIDVFTPAPKISGVTIAHVIAQLEASASSARGVKQRRRAKAKKAVQAPDPT
jgi:hypothetical protein